MDSDNIVPIFAIFMIFGMPMLLGAFAIWTSHQKAKFRAQQSHISHEDREQLEQLHRLADRLSDRVETLESILDAEVPDWRDDHEQPR